MNRDTGAGLGRGVAAMLGVAGVAFLLSGCPKAGRTPPDDSGSGKADALFLARAPVVVPEELEADLGAMGIGRLYLAAAAVDSSGRVRALPVPPAPLKSPVWLTVQAAEGTPPGLPGGASADTFAAGLTQPLAELKRQCRVVGVHLHLPCDPSQAEQLAALAAAVRKSTGLPVSVTIVPGADPSRWKPLAGSADEVLAFAMGRRPEVADQMVPELTEEGAKAIPLPYRLLVVPGSYGFGGGGKGRRIPDGEVDLLSEDRNLDFDFGQVLSTDAGSLYNFKARAGADSRSTLLSSDGGTAKFQVLSIYEIGRILSSAGTWTGTGLKGRVFLVEGLPKDGHLLGFEALRALLLGRPLEPKLTIEAVGTRALRGSVEFSLKVSNLVPLPTELSRMGNWIRVRADGGVFASASPGDFDRYELNASGEEGARPAPFGRATVCKLFENIFVPGESNDAGPFRVTGARPRVFVSYHLVQTDGKTVESPEFEVVMEAPLPETAAAPPARKPSRR